MPDEVAGSERHLPNSDPHNLTADRSTVPPDNSSSSNGSSIEIIADDGATAVLVRRSNDGDDGGNDDPQPDPDEEPELVGPTPFTPSTTTALNCGYECSRYIYSQPITRLSYDSLTNEQRETMKTEYYQNYDFMIGVRTAASLGGAIALFSLFILYKTKCGSDSKRRRASSVSSGAGSGSSWRRRRRPPASSVPPPGGEIDVEKDIGVFGGGISGPSFVAGGYPALVSDDRTTRVGGATGGGRRDSRVFFPPSPLTPLSPAAPPTAGADIFQFPSGARFFDRKSCVSGAAGGLSTYHDSPRLSCGNILPAGYHRAALPRRGQASLESAAVLLHYGEISPRPFPLPGSRKSSCGAAPLPTAAAVPVGVRRDHIQMAPLGTRMKVKRKCTDAEKSGLLLGAGDPIDIQIIQPTPNVSPCGSTRRLSEDVVTVHAITGVRPRRTLSGGSRPRSQSDNAAPNIPLLAIPKVHRHHHTKSTKAKRFRDNSTQMSFETQEGGQLGVGRDRSNSAGTTVTSQSRPFSYVPVASTAATETSSSATSPMGAPLCQQEVSTEDVCEAAAAVAKPPSAGGGGIRFIDCSDSDGFSLSSDSGAFGSLDSDRPPGSPMNWAGAARVRTGLLRGLIQRAVDEAAGQQPDDAGTDVVPADVAATLSADEGATCAAVEFAAGLLCGEDLAGTGTGSRRKVIGADPDAAVSETQC